MTRILDRILGALQSPSRVMFSQRPCSLLARCGWLAEIANSVASSTVHRTWKARPGVYPRLGEDVILSVCMGPSSGACPDTCPSVVFPDWDRRGEAR